MEVAVVNIQGKETGRKITLSEAVFGKRLSAIYDS